MKLSSSKWQSVAASAPGSVAAQAEMRKIAKYSLLNSTLYSFMPVAIHWAHSGRGLLNSSEAWAGGLRYKVVIH